MCNFWDIKGVTIHSSMKFPSSHGIPGWKLDEIFRAFQSNRSTPKKTPARCGVLTEKILGLWFQILLCSSQLEKQIFIKFHIYINNYISFQPSSYFIIAPLFLHLNPWPNRCLFKTVGWFLTCSALSNATCRSRRCPRKEPKEAENLRVLGVPTPSKHIGIPGIPGGRKTQQHVFIVKKKWGTPLFLWSSIPVC